MRRLALSLLCLPLSLAAGGFKRFYPAQAGLLPREVKALPGGAVAIRCAPDKGEGGNWKMLLVPNLRSFSSPADVVPRSGDPGGELVWMQGDRRLSRTLDRPRLTLASAPRTGSESGSPIEPQPSPPAGPFRLEGTRFYWTHPGAKTQLFELTPRAALIEWGQTDEFGWIITSSRRELPGLPPRREIQIFSARDGRRLASTTIAKEAPGKQLAAAFKPDGPDQPGALAVITGGGLEWWSPAASDLDRWGEVTIAPPPAVAAAPAAK